MCAAKLERTAFVLRNVWPNVKQQTKTFADEQSGSFIRKNSGKTEPVAALAVATPRHAPAQTQQGSVFPAPARGNALRQQRTRLGSGPRHVASDFLRVQAGFKHARAFSSASTAVSANEQHQQQQQLFEPLATVLPRDDRLRSGISIDELIQSASEKYKLNADFWGKYTDIPSMALASDKEEVLQIIENFVLIHRKHVYLFQRLKNTVMKNLALWSAPDLAALCHAWAQLGFLHEDLCLAMADRVTATVRACDAQELCWLMDAYATARCSVRSVTEEITLRTLVTLDDFTLQQLCLHASSFARLNIHHEELFKAMSSHLVRKGEVSSSAGQDQGFSARDLTLAAYSFAKLGFFFPEVFRTIALNALVVIRDFTARDLQMLLVAFARAQYQNSDLLSAVSLQAQRRMAQFSAESLTLTLRSLAFFDHGDSGLFTRAVAQLPRMILTFRPADVTTLLSAFAAVQVHSESLFDVVTPYILEKAPMFTPSDWLLALHSFSALGHRDTMFLDAMSLHLEASKLSLRQLSAAMVDCSRLSFSGHSESLAEAVAAKLGNDAQSAAACPDEVVAKMYAALLLLGHSLPRSAPTVGYGSCLPVLLSDLALRLSATGACKTLSPATRISLCYAMMIAPPVRGHDHHPVLTALLLEQCLAEAEMLTTEERCLLRQVLRAQELVPWNRQAPKFVEPPGLDLETECSEPLAPFFHAALHHLAPMVPSLGEAAPTAATEGESVLGGEGPVSSLPASRWRGIFVAHEVRRGLEEMSEALAAVGIENRLVTDSRMEAHVLLPVSAVRSTQAVASAAAMDPGRSEIALMWGSSVHYTSGSQAEILAGAEEAQPRLSLSTKFQVALLQAVAGVEVAIVPHWWWQSCDGIEGSGQRLVALLANSSELPARPPPGLEVAAARLRTTSCIE